MLSTRAAYFRSWHSSESGREGHRTLCTEEKWRNGIGSQRRDKLWDHEGL